MEWVSSSTHPYIHDYWLTSITMEDPKVLNGHSGPNWTLLCPFPNSQHDKAKILLIKKLPSFSLSATLIYTSSPLSSSLFPFP